jgi:polysaccharide biosynthesis/export protein
MAARGISTVPMMTCGPRHPIETMGVSLSETVRTYIAALLAIKLSHHFPKWWDSFDSVAGTTCRLRAAKSSGTGELTMAGTPSVALMRDIGTLFDTGTRGGLSDRQLLEQFAGQRDAAAEAAFEVLVLRHGPMVLRVCRNVLGDSTDAEDAFQATFLVLVRRCGSIRQLESLGSWLYGVACRVAARARVDAAKRRSAERRGALRVVQPVDVSGAGEPDRAEFGAVIQEEVQRLPENYRAVVALCYWEGLTQEQAAVQLGCPLGTVRSRLARARYRLHRRLTRRGLAPLAGLLAAALDAPSAEAARLWLVPNHLIRSTVTASAQILAGRAVSDVASKSVAILTQSVLRRMLMMKFRMAAVSLVLIGLGAYGGSLAAPQAERGKSPPESRRGLRLTAEKSKSKAQPAIVSLGDYVVEPPDMILVEVLAALPGRPISGERLVRPDGKISLGFYGDVYVAGLTVPEVKEKIIHHLQRFINDDALGLLEKDEATGKPAVDPATKQPLMINPKESATVFVDVTAYNSKNYYLLGAVFLPGRLPVTGTDTILDAINYAGGLTPRANHENVILYRQPKKGGPLQALHVDIDQITMGDDMSTNYQLLPGDRLVVPHNPSAEAEPAQVGAAHPAQHRSGPALYFGRPPSSSDEPADRLTDFRDAHAERRVKVRDLPSAVIAPMSRVEARLNDLEQKLDQILEALKTREP